jgi:hypothetical protein
MKSNFNRSLPQKKIIKMEYPLAKNTNEDNWILHMPFKTDD